MSEGFLERLKRLRKARKFSQERLAEAIGISYSAYRRYESGERDMPLTVAIDSRGGNIYESGPAAYLESLKGGK